jgi:hypothetical protein
MAAARQREHRAAIHRDEAAQVEHARLDPVLGEPLGDAQADVDERAVGNDREVIAAAAQRRTAERDRRRRFVADRLPDARIAIQRDVLVAGPDPDRRPPTPSARASCGVDGTTIFRPAVR